MPLRRKPRICGSNEIRIGVAIRRAMAALDEDQHLKHPATPTVPAMTVAENNGSCRQISSTTSTTIMVRLNSTGENAVSMKRCSAFRTPIITMDGPTKEVRHHQPRVVDGELQRLPPDKARRQHAMTSGISNVRTSNDDQNEADAAERAPAKAAAAQRLRFRARADSADQRRVQRAFREGAARDIDELEGHQKRPRSGLPSSAAIKASRTNPNVREASVPVEMVRI
jgi:hypothetical protein